MKRIYNQITIRQKLELLSQLRIFPFLIVLLLMTVVLVPSASGDSPLEKQKVIRVAGDNNFPPFEYLSDSGVYEGFNVDILNAISIETGIKLEYHPMSWNEALEALTAGEVDAIQGMKYSQEREALYRFSEPYLMSTEAIFVPKENLYIFDLQDLEGRTIATQKGDIANDLLKNLQRVRIISTDSQKEAMHLLLQGKVEAFVGNRILGQYVLEQENKQSFAKIVGKSLEPTGYCIAVFPQHQDLLAVFNDGITKIKRNGTYDKIQKKWFSQYDLPPQFNVDKVLFYAKAGLAVLAALVVLILWWNRLLKREVARRITEQQLMQKEIEREDRLRSLGQLVLGIAHEIRNPLMSILTYTELLPKKINNEQFREFFAQHVPQEIMRLNGLVNELLDFARPKPAEPQVFSADEMIQSITFLFKQKLQEKKITVELDFGEGLVVFADRQQMKQVFINIILNAIQSVEMQGNISIRGERKEGMAVIAIEDNGMGIEPANLDKIFEPFYTRKTNGVGLGLSISYQLVKANRGRIEAKSSPGLGTAITVQLPVPERRDKDEAFGDH
ncbi:MAG: transporter substrate-binding domain-containing protein [Desulfitobacteriaceae bacterium]